MVHLLQRLELNHLSSICSQLSQLSQRITFASDRVVVAKRVVESLNRRALAAESSRQTLDEALTAGYEEDVRMNAGRHAVD